MSWGEQLKEEIKTIKKRNITIKLSDADCEKLMKKAGMHGLTISELIENFIGDLLDGTYSNGSDERMYANQWFERCYFGTNPEMTLLNHLLCNGYHPEAYIELSDDIDMAEKEKKYLEEHPEEIKEEIQYPDFLDAAICSWKEELKEMKEGWKNEKEANMKTELEFIKKWIKEREMLINGK